VRLNGAADEVALSSESDDGGGRGSSASAKLLGHAWDRSRNSARDAPHAPQAGVPPATLQKPRWWRRSCFGRNAWPPHWQTRWSRNYGDLDMIAHGWHKRPNSNMDESVPAGGSPGWISRLVVMSRPNNSLIIHSCLLLAYCSTVWAWVSLATPCPMCHVCLDDTKSCVANRRRTLPLPCSIYLARV
jgi:hypothetical protein